MDAGDILVMQNEINNPEMLLRIASERNLIIVWNPAPMTQEVALCPLNCVSILIMNEVEAGQLAGTQLDPTCLDSIRRTAEVLRKMVPETDLLLTLGKEGSILFSPNPELNEFFVPACNLGKPVDTTAAGDTYLGYLV